jgi:drug/metabolite transporter (DMT)-like permease
MKTKQHDSSFLAPLALAAGTLCIGFSAIFVKLAAVPGPASAFYRMLIAAVVLVPWWLSGSRPAISRRDLLIIAAGGLSFALDNMLWNTSLLRTSAATATLLANNAPLWVGLGSLLLFRERLPARFWCGIPLALGGMAVIAGSDAWKNLNFNSGDLMAVSAGIFYAGYLLTTGKARRRVDTLSFMTVSVVVSVVFLFLLNLSLGTPLTGYPAKSWAALLGLGLVSHLCGWLCINYALGHMKSAPVSVTLLGQNIITALLAIPLLGEPLGANQIYGGLLILAGIYLVNRK